MSTSPSSVATFRRKIKTVAKPRFAQQRKSGYVSQAPPNAYKLSHFETHTNQINGSLRIFAEHGFWRPCATNQLIDPDNFLYAFQRYIFRHFSLKYCVIFYTRSNRKAQTSDEADHLVFSFKFTSNLES